MPNITTNPIRLICFDVDYTLLTDEQILTEKTETTLKKLQQMGITLMIATGKNLASTRQIVDVFSLDSPLIFINGSLIQFADGEIIHKHTIPFSNVQRILELGEGHNTEMMLYFTDETVVQAGGRFSFALDRYGGPSPRVVEKWTDLGDMLQQVLKIVFIDGEDHKCLEEMNDILLEEIETGIDTVFSLPILLEVQPQGVCKGTALQQVAKMLHIPREEIIAFGDGNNDKEMLQFAGIGVALQNATPELKLTADQVVPSNNEEGPANFLCEFFNLR